MPLSADTSYITMLRSTIYDKQIIKQCGTSGFAVYMVIKASSDYNTGESSVSYDEIHDITGLSRSTIALSVRELTDCGYIRVTLKSSHKKKIYTCTDFVEVFNKENNEIVSEMVIESIPSELKRTVQAIKEYVNTNGDAKVIINNQNITVNIINNNYFNGADIKDVKKALVELIYTSDEVKESIESLMESYYKSKKNS